MAKDNEKFGFSPGPYKVIEGLSIPIKLHSTGLNVEDAPMDLGDTEAVDMSDVRIMRDGIGPELGFAMFPPVSLSLGPPSPILHITGYQRSDQSKLVVRMLADRWEWYNGTVWAVIPGTVGGLLKQRLYSTVMDDKLIAANGYTKLKSWDGNFVNSVVDLSAEAPRAKFVTRIGQRLFVAYATFNGVGDLDPNGVAWSADGDMLEWTDTSLGAGSLSLKSEGTVALADTLTGLSNIERGILLYRQRSLVLAQRTGVRAAPFRFATIDFSHGTESPYSIAHGGLNIGDFFLGFDFVVYHFDGQNPPTPVGLPIQRRLEARISNLAECVGYINPLTMDYCLLSPTSNQVAPMLGDMHTFSIRDYIRKQRLSWSYRPLTLATSTGTYVPKVAQGTLPVVNTFNTVADVVDPTTAPFTGAGLGLPTGAIGGFFGAYGMYSSYTGAPSDTLPPDSIQDVGTNPLDVPKFLTNITARGVRTFLQLPTGSHGQYLSIINGTLRFDKVKWKTEASKFNTPAIVAAVEAAYNGGLGPLDGLLFFDEPNHSSWGPAGWMTKAIVDELATHLRSIFPTVPLGPACTYKWRPTEHYEVIDFQHPATWAFETDWAAGPLVHLAAAQAQQAAERLLNADGKAPAYFYVVNIAAGPQVAGCETAPGQTTCFFSPQMMLDWAIPLAAAGGGVAFWKYFPTMWTPARKAAMLTIKQSVDLLPRVNLRRL